MLVVTLCDEDFIIDQWSLPWNSAILVKLSCEIVLKASAGLLVNGSLPISGSFANAVSEFSTGKPLAPRRLYPRTFLLWGDSASHRTTCALIQRDVPRHVEALLQTSVLSLTSLSEIQHNHLQDSARRFFTYGFKPAPGLKVSWLRKCCDVCSTCTEKFQFFWSRGPGELFGSGMAYPCRRCPRLTQLKTTELLLTKSFHFCFNKSAAVDNWHGLFLLQTKPRWFDMYRQF